MQFSWYELVLLFFLYSVVGWLWETVYCSLKAGKFIYRGFLVGPYCPIYGFGVVGVLLLVRSFEHNLVLLYIFSAVIVTILEYLTSYLLEKFFHATWWDYHDVPLNINGRVALPISLFWGLACVVIVKFVQPEMMHLVSFLLNIFGGFLPNIITVVLLVDTIYTVMSMKAFQQKMRTFKADLDEKKASFETEWDEQKDRILAVLKDEKKVPALSFNHRHFLRNFRLKAKHFPELPQVKQWLNKK